MKKFILVIMTCLANHKYKKKIQLGSSFWQAHFVFYTEFCLAWYAKASLSSSHRRHTTKKWHCQRPTKTTVIDYCYIYVHLLDLNMLLNFWISLAHNILYGPPHFSVRGTADKCSKHVPCVLSRNMSRSQKRFWVLDTHDPGYGISVDLGSQIFILPGDSNDVESYPWMTAIGSHGSCISG